MSITIPAELEEFVNRIVASGRFEWEEEVVSEALRLLPDRERKLAALREDIRVGIVELDQGEGGPLDVDDILIRGTSRNSEN